MCVYNRISSTCILALTIPFVFSCRQPAELTGASERPLYQRIVKQGGRVKMIARLAPHAVQVQLLQEPLSYPRWVHLITRLVARDDGEDVRLHEYALDTHTRCTTSLQISHSQQPVAQAAPAQRNIKQYAPGMRPNTASAACQSVQFHCRGTSVLGKTENLSLGSAMEGLAWPSTGVVVSTHTWGPPDPQSDRPPPNVVSTGGQGCQAHNQLLLCSPVGTKGGAARRRRVVAESRD